MPACSINSRKFVVIETSCRKLIIEQGANGKIACIVKPDDVLERCAKANQLSSISCSNSKATLNDAQSFFVAASSGFENYADKLYAWLSKFSDDNVAPTKLSVWEVQLGDWKRYGADETRLFRYAESKGVSTFSYPARDYIYSIDLTAMKQTNMDTRAVHSIRRCEEECELGAPRSKRLSELVNCILSPSVQVPLPVEASEELAKLSEAEVISVFTTHVPGVEKLPYRDTGERAVKYIPKGYLNGLPAFAGTEMHNHLLWLLRLIVHYGHAGKTGASRYLRDVAEAFMDCQAVQARVIERVGLEIRGVKADFKGMVVAFLGEYKTMALKMLAAERVANTRVYDDSNPTHYENRLTADIGDMVGLNSDDVRRAILDEHADNRFESLKEPELELDLAFAADRCRDLFDIEVVTKAFANEVNSFSESSGSDSLPRMFLDWASLRLKPKHIVFDEETCSKVDVDETLALAIMEILFFGKVLAPPGTRYRGHLLSELFVESEDITAAVDQED